MLLLISPFLYSFWFYTSPANSESRLYYNTQRDVLEKLLQKYTKWLQMRTDFYKEVSKMKRSSFITRNFTKYYNGLDRPTLYDRITLLEIVFKNFKIKHAVKAKLHTLSNNLSHLQKEVAAIDKDLIKRLSIVYVRYPKLFSEQESLSSYIFMDKNDMILSKSKNSGIPLSQFISLADGYYFLKIALNNPNNPPFDEHDFKNGLDSMLNKAYSDSFTLPGVANPKRGASMIFSFFPYNDCSKTIKFLL